MIEGVYIKKLVRRFDERGFFEELIKAPDDFFREGFGQLSHSVMKPGVIKAWHIHKTQTDWWYVSRGSLKVVLFDLRDKVKTAGNFMEMVLGEDGENIVLKIPSQVAHGCKVLKKEKAELFYVTSGEYDSNEEGRLPDNDSRIGYDWITEKSSKEKKL